MELSDDDMQIKYESGNSKVFLDRISWALSALTATGLLEQPNEIDRRFYHVSSRCLPIR